MIRKLTYQEIRGVNQLIRDVGVLDVNAPKYLRKTSGALISIPQSMPAGPHSPGWIGLLLQAQEMSRPVPKRVAVGQIVG